MIDFSNCYPGQYIIFYRYSKFWEVCERSIGKIWRTKTIYDKTKTYTKIWYMLENYSFQNLVYVYWLENYSFQYTLSDKDNSISMYDENDIKHIGPMIRFADDEIQLRLMID
jgi:hypothetical protein